MMIGDDQQQQDEEQEPAMVLGEDLQPPDVGSVDVSEDLLAAHISHDKNTLFGFQSDYRIAMFGH